jgi:glutamine synthetase type III
MVKAQTRSIRSGISVDAERGVDPTKNVIDLVEALKVALAEFRTSDIKYVDTQLVAAEKLQDYAREAESKMNTISLAAETRAAVLVLCSLSC